MIHEILFEKSRPRPITRSVVQRLCALGVAEKDVHELQELAHAENWTPERLARELEELCETVLAALPETLPA